MAIPLCLPNNCTWDSETRQCVQTKEKRRSLYVVEEALEQLREIEGPVCVVSTAGPCRKGKSFVLSEGFRQPEVFPLGHHFTPETMGIWLWIVPGVFKDSTGQEFKVVLLDSEGIDSVNSEGYDDNQIFTLTVLLASVLIYNSQGVPARRDLEGLNYIVKLSQSIEVRSNTKAEAGKSQDDSKSFYETFPFFIWLLRDVTHDLPPDCNSVKDYFLKKVFNVSDSSSAENQDRQKVADSIKDYFSGFEAFSLPPPTADKELLKNIKDNESQMIPFFQELDKFRRLLENILSPKKSFNEGELVTGEALAALVQLYVEAINSPGVIPNIQNAWETFVERKCSKAITEAVKKYEEVMESNLKEERPCNNDELRTFHGMALKKGEGYFMTKLVGISTRTAEKHLNKLKSLLNEKLISWKTRNEKLTREFCNSLLRQLKEKHLDPVRRRLQGKKAAKMSFDEINGACDQIKEDYHNSAIGAKDVIDAVFAEFQPALSEERKLSLNILGKLKDSDEKLAKARQQQEKQRLEGATSLRPHWFERRSPASSWEFNLNPVFNWLSNGNKDEEANARAAPSGSASEGIQNTRPTISMGNNPGTASVSSFGWGPLQQIFGGNSSQPPSMGSFLAGSLGLSDRDVSWLRYKEEYATRKTDNFMRQFKRETRMNKPPFPYFSDKFYKPFE